MSERDISIQDLQKKMRLMEFKFKKECQELKLELESQKIKIQDLEQVNSEVTVNEIKNNVVKVVNRGI